MGQGYDAAEARRGPVKLAVVGLGLAGESHLCDALARPDLFDVVAVCGRDRDRAEAVAQRYAVPRAYVDVHALLDHERECEAIVVATPPEVAAAILQEAVASGRAVLAEKPGGVTPEELAEVDTTARVAFAYNRRYQRAWTSARAWVRSGRIGHVTTIVADWRGPFEVRYADDAPTHRGRLHGRGRGVLLDIGAHALDAALFVTGRLGHARACRLEENARGVDVGAQVELVDANGCRLHLVIGPGGGRRLELVGTRGRIVIDESTARMDADDGCTTVDDADEARPIEDLARDRACRGATLSEARSVLTVVREAYRRARIGTRAWQRPRAKAWARRSGAC